MRYHDAHYTTKQEPFPFSKKWIVRKYQKISNEMVNSDNNAINAK